MCTVEVVSAVIAESTLLVSVPPRIVTFTSCPALWSASCFQIA